MELRKVEWHQVFYMLLCFFVKWQENSLFLIVLGKVSGIGIVPRKETNELENLDNVFFLLRHEFRLTTTTDTFNDISTTTTFIYLSKYLTYFLNSTKIGKLTIYPLPLDYWGYPWNNYVIPNIFMLPPLGHLRTGINEATPLQINRNL